MIFLSFTSISIVSPSSTIPSGPASAASGDTYPMLSPLVPPENLPSVIIAQLLYNAGFPFNSSWKVNAVVPNLAFKPRKRMIIASPS